MKKTKKRILGLLCLVLVAITTIFAALLPDPGASAVRTQSVTDEILVRVVGEQPDIRNIKPDYKSVFSYPEPTVSFDYENVEYITVTMVYKDQNNIEHTIYVLKDTDPESYVNYVPGSFSKNLTDLDLAGNYGYGEYKVHVEGTGDYGGAVADTSFTLYPVIGTASENENEQVFLDLVYDTGDSNIGSIQVNVYDEFGNLVKELSPTIVQPGTTRVEFPFSKNGLDSGKYSFEIIALDANGKAISKAYIAYLTYTATPSKDIIVPNTGGAFGSIGMSQNDCLITGLAIFLIVAVVGFAFIAKGRKNNKRASIKRRR